MTGMIQLVLAAAFLVGAVLAAAWFIWGKKPQETMQDVLQGRATLFDQQIDLGASTTGAYPFTALPGGTVEITAALVGRGELNLRVIDDAEYKRLSEARKPLHGNDLQHHAGFAVDDIKGTRTVRGKLGAGKFHVILQNDNIFAGLQVRLAVVQDYSK